MLCSLWMMVSRSWVDMDVPQLMGCALVIGLLQTQVKLWDSKSGGFCNWIDLHYKGRLLSIVLLQK